MIMCLLVDSQPCFLSNQIPEFVFPKSSQKCSRDELSVTEASKWHNLNRLSFVIDIYHYMKSIVIEQKRLVLGFHIPISLGKSKSKSKSCFLQHMNLENIYSTVATKNLCEKLQLTDFHRLVNDCKISQKYVLGKMRTGRIYQVNLFQRPCPIQYRYLNYGLIDLFQ